MQQLDAGPVPRTLPPEDGPPTRRVRLRIAQVAPPFESVPPTRYGGTERVVAGLVEELHARGHEVTTFASGDSSVPGRLVASVPKALRPAGYPGDAMPHMVATIELVVREAGDFDVIHSHLEWPGLLIARATATPAVSTFHGRLDTPLAGELLEMTSSGLVAISRHQARFHPTVPWTAIIHHGLDVAAAPFERRAGDDLCFVGRICPEKGVLDAIEVARLTGRRLRIAAKVGPTPQEQAYFESAFKPALQRADVEFLGELGAADRDRLMATSAATLVPGAWPEPFGLVVVESLACGTPVVARRVGALPEILREGIDGYFGDDATHLAFLVDRAAKLDRAEIRAGAVEHFSRSRMVDAYETAYASVIEAARDASAVSAASASRATPVPVRASHLSSMATLRG